MLPPSAGHLSELENDNSDAEGGNSYVLPVTIPTEQMLRRLKLRSSRWLGGAISANLSEDASTPSSALSCCFRS